jgi:hypothetical protein
MGELKTRGILCDEPTQERWGIRTAIRLPGGGRLGLYQPQHPMAMGLWR